MAGGNITRIVGGSNTIETETWEVFTKDFQAYAGKGSHFTADGGTIIGEPKEADAGKYFKNGQWKNKDGKRITKAKIGDTVYFHVEMTKKFPNTDQQKIINFKLFEFDGYRYYVKNIYSIPSFPTPIPVYVDTEKVPIKKQEQEIRYVSWIDKDKDGIIDEDEKDTKTAYTEIEATENKAVILFRLEEALLSYLNELGELKLFMSLTYDDETVNLPEDEESYLEIEPTPPIIKEIYVKLLNFEVSPLVILALNEIDAKQQHIRGNDDEQSSIVNLDYFSVKINKLPPNMDIDQLYKLIKREFLCLASDSLNFYGHGFVPRQTNMSVNGNWKFMAYPKKNDPTYERKQERIFFNGVSHPIFYIEAGSESPQAKPIVDHGAVVVSEFSDMCWLFTTINTKKSKSQPFSGHRQFGIHQDEEGCYRVFTRALDRVWPDDSLIGSKSANFGNMDDTVKDYFTIANGTWNAYMKNVSKLINKDLKGEATIMKPEISRINFQKFLDVYGNEGLTIHVGNIPQEKVYQKK